MTVNSGIDVRSPHLRLAIHIGPAAYPSGIRPLMPVLTLFFKNGSTYVRSYLGREFIHHLFFKCGTPPSYDVPHAVAGSKFRGHSRVAKSCQVVCRSHDLPLEQVWKIRMLFILHRLSEVGISYVDFTNIDNLAWCQKKFYTQLARA